MKKYLLLLLMAITFISCSKKVELTGKVSGGSPLERIELIEGSGVATLPLINIGLDKDGKFSGSFDAPKDGIYVLSYAGKQNLIYLKGGQTVNINGNAANFPAEYVVTGDAKENNDFLKQTQKFLVSYAQKFNMQDLVTKKEPEFLKAIQKIETDLNKNIDEVAGTTKADSDVVKWKKNDLVSTLLNVMSQYKMNYGKLTNNPAFKVSKAFTDYENKLQPNKDELIQQSPSYRNYLLSTMGEEYMKYSAEKMKTNVDASTSEVFADFLNSKKEISQLEKDYLLAYVIAQSDITPSADANMVKKVNDIIEKNIKDATVKKDIQHLQFVISGVKLGDLAPDAALTKEDGKAFKFTDLKGKPSLVMFYASWNPGIAENTVSVLNDVMKHYNGKINLVAINMDDTKDQFAKTHKALLNGIAATHVYADGGMNSAAAKAFGIYGFKLPSFVIINKDGKIASKPIYNLGEPEFIEAMTKETGVAAPAAPQAELNMDPSILAPEMAAPQPAK